MEWLKTLAPLIGTALGGPLGGAAAAFIADKLGLEGKTIEAVTEVMNSGKLSADQISAIKLAELDFQKFLESNKIDLAKLDVENTKSARDMQMSTKSLTPSILSYLITSGFFGILAVLMAGVYEPNDTLLVMLGSLGTAWLVVVNFWFGSTRGSQNKDVMLANSTPPK